MAEFALPRSDEPFDFRHQASSYGLWRRDYSAALYDAVAEHAGAARGGSPSTSAAARASSRRASDTASGTRSASTSRPHAGGGARVAAGGTLRLVRARGEALPLRDERGVARHRAPRSTGWRRCGTRGVPPCARAGWLGGALLARYAARGSRRSGWWRRCSRSRRPDVARVRGIPRPPCRPVRGLGARERAAAPAAHGALLHGGGVPRLRVDARSGSDASPGRITRRFSIAWARELSAHHPDGFEGTERGAPVPRTPPRLINPARARPDRHRARGVREQPDPRVGPAVLRAQQLRIAGAASPGTGTARRRCSPPRRTSDTSGRAWRSSRNGRSGLAASIHVAPASSATQVRVVRTLPSGAAVRSCTTSTPSSATSVTTPEREGGERGCADQPRARHQSPCRERKGRTAARNPGGLSPMTGGRRPPRRRSGCRERCARSAPPRRRSGCCSRLRARGASDSVAARRPTTTPRRCVPRRRRSRDRISTSSVPPVPCAWRGGDARVCWPPCDED